MFFFLRFGGPNGPSGFGFELTLRLRREDGESSPPTWPAELMQGLARYVFSTGSYDRLSLFSVAVNLNVLSNYWDQFVV